MGLGFERADLVDETLGIYEDAKKNEASAKFRSERGEEVH